MPVHFFTPESDVINWYNKYLGRGPEEGIWDQYKYQNPFTVEAAIRDSAEAALFRTRQAQQNQAPQAPQYAPELEDLYQDNPSLFDVGQTDERDAIIGGSAGQYFDPTNPDTFNPRDAMIARDYPSWLDALKNAVPNYGTTDQESENIQSALQDVIRNVSYDQNAGMDPGVFLSGAIEKLRRQAMDAAAGGGGSAGGGGGAGAGAGETDRHGLTGGPIPPNQFTDPITGPISDAAALRVGQLENPPGGSGQALFEEALRNIAQQFQSGGYTPAEQEIFQTQAIDPLEQLRTTRKQQVLENISRRGLDPRSGVAIQMLEDVDRQFDQLRTTTQANLSGQFAQENVARLLQSLQMLGNLSGTENQRMDQAFQYRTVPMNLADRAFNQAFQTYNAAGNPLSLVNPLTQLYNAQAGQSAGMQQALGYLAYILSQGR